MCIGLDDRPCMGNGPSPRTPPQMRIIHHTIPSCQVGSCLPISAYLAPLPSVSASGLSDLHVLHYVSWQVDNGRLIFPFCLSISCFLTWEVCALTQEHHRASQAFWLASVWVDPSFGNLWRRGGSSYISLVTSHPAHPHG